MAKKPSQQSMPVSEQFTKPVYPEGSLAERTANFDDRVAMLEGKVYNLEVKNGKQGEAIAALELKFQKHFGV